MNQPRLRTLGPPTLQDRAAGVLLHPTSLPNHDPIGDLGPAAHAFADFLSAAGQRWWQMLPLGPTGPSHSPYQTYSAFAGNPLLISLDLLAREGLLKRASLSQKGGRDGHVDYEAAGTLKEQGLRKAFENFTASVRPSQRDSFRRFLRNEKFWIDDFGLFAALRKSYQEPWLRWPRDVRLRHPQALAGARSALAPEVRYHQFVQWLFVTQWQALRRYGAGQGIGLIGDIPIFAALDSADVWANQDIFKLKADGAAAVVSGVPPDYFSKTGQRWGNPHYRWDVLERQGYRWWIERFRKTFNYFDAVRLDHFIGFVRFYEIPGGAPTAEKGKYCSGPGARFFKEVVRRLGHAPFIAEDLGVVTPAVKKLRDQFELPGMRVLQFAFGNDPEARNYQPHNYPRHCVVYTGTHDNDTTVGWFKERSSAKSTRSRSDIEKERRFTLEYLHSDGRRIHWDMIRAASASVGNTVIIPMQDLLGLGPEARMNLPGTPTGNWEWRMQKGQITPSLTRQLRELTDVYGRS